MKINVVLSILTLLLIDLSGASRELSVDEPFECPSDPEAWAPWSSWTECTANCGKVGTQTRTRTFEPSCREGVQGHWSHWTSWATSSDGGGAGGGRVIVRTRVCDEPVPDFDGDVCEGNASEVKACSQDPIVSIDGGWAEWGISSWTSSNPSGTARERTKTRTCTNPAPDCGGAECPGSGSETELERMPCTSVSEVGTWSSWVEWTTVKSASFTGRQRTRTCVDEEQPECDGKLDCPGDGSETQPCLPFSQAAEGSSRTTVSASWSTWTDFMGVTTPTDGGNSGRFRSRSCTEPQGCDEPGCQRPDFIDPSPGCVVPDCKGPDFELEPCDCTSVETRECSGEPCHCNGLCRAQEKICRRNSISQQRCDAAKEKAASHGCSCSGSA